MQFHSQKSVQFNKIWIEKQGPDERIKSRNDDKVEQVLNGGTSQLWRSLGKYLYIAPVLVTAYLTNFTFNFTLALLWANQPIPLNPNTFSKIIYI